MSTKPIIEELEKALEHARSIQSDSTALYSVIVSITTMTQDSTVHHAAFGHGKAPLQLFGVRRAAQIIINDNPAALVLVEQMEADLTELNHELN